LAVLNELTLWPRIKERVEKAFTFVGEPYWASLDKVPARFMFKEKDDTVGKLIGWIPKNSKSLALVWDVERLPSPSDDEADNSDISGKVYGKRHKSSTKEEPLSPKLKIKDEPPILPRIKTEKRAKRVVVPKSPVLEATEASPSPMPTIDYAEAPSWDNPPTLIGSPIPVLDMV
jgi:hypothetical protein